jgi:hypothetical protein
LYGDRNHVVALGQTLAGASVAALERLRLTHQSRQRSYLMVHIDLPGEDPLATIAALRAWPDSLVVELQSLLPAGWAIRRGHRHPTLLIHLVAADGCPASPMSDRYESWPAWLQWLWLVASGTPEHIFPPDPEDNEPRAAVLYLSADWRAMVLRDGTAFLGLTPAGSTPFHSIADVFVRTIYADVMLLGGIQADLLHEHADQLAALHDQPDPRSGLREMESSLLNLRNFIWWQNLSDRRVCNDLMAAFHRQHGLERLMSQIVSDHGDWHRTVESERERELNGIVGFISIVGLPFGLAYTATAAVTAPSFGAFATATVIGLAGSVGVIAATPAGRDTLSFARLRRRKQE